ncbi:MAG TPA: NAD(P)-dependent oxidoreductase [Trichocoleus sp.]|jgi:3-hydroxyisobutyrate dehydrogenase
MREMAIVKLGLIGTGLMGLPMVQRLLETDIAVVAYNRTIEKLEPLQATEAEIASSVSEVLQSCSAVLLMLSDASAIRSVLFSEETKPYFADRTIIQMGTIAPDESRSLRDDTVNLGGNYLEAPVLGSIPEVKAGTLQIMVGATPEQLASWSPVLQRLGTPQLIGEVGTAAALKLALNQLIASLTTAFASSLGLVQRQGVPIETFMQILRQSALYAPTFDKKLQRMVDRHFDSPNFPTKHLLKDTNLFWQAAIESGLKVDNLEGIRHILETACEMGLAEADYSALYAAVNPEE